MDGVVEVIAERIGDRIRHDDFRREMGDRIDFMFVDQPRDQFAVAEIADRQRRGRGHGPGESGRQIVDDDDLFAGVDQPQSHMAADIAGAAGDQN